MFLLFLIHLFLDKKLFYSFIFHIRNYVWIINCLYRLFLRCLPSIFIDHENFQGGHGNFQIINCLYRFFLLFFWPSLFIDHENFQGGQYIMLIDSVSVTELAKVSLLLHTSLRWIYFYFRFIYIIFSGKMQLVYWFLCFFSFFILSFLYRICVRDFFKTPRQIFMKLSERIHYKMNYM